MRVKKESRTTPAIWPLILLLTGLIAPHTASAHSVAHEQDSNNDRVMAAQKYGGGAPEQRGGDRHLLRSYGVQDHLTARHRATD